mmetsp:Transcript_59401/g.165889  ORF Transcript_59401/g.165889 Transcript_59401/m.165889 type:complete len:861 (-) Transcript_59401:233-2815(-)
MLSTLLGAASHGEGVSLLRRTGAKVNARANATNSVAGNSLCRLQPRRAPSPLLRGPLVALLRGPAPVATSSQLRLCGGTAPGGRKPPPKGFEKFYRDSPQGSSEQAESKDHKTKEGPEESQTQSPGGAKESNDTGKAGSKPASGEKQGGATSETKSSSSSGPGGHSSSPGGKGREVRRETIAMGLGVAAFALYSMSGRDEPEDEITIQEMLREYLMKGYVDRVQIVNKRICRVRLRHDAPADMANKTLVIQLGTPEVFEVKLEQVQNELGLSPMDHVPVQYVNETDFLAEILPFLPSLLLLIPLILAARAMSSGMGGMPGGGGGPGGRNIFTIGKAFPSGSKDLKSKVKFTDVAGMEQAKKEVVEFVDFLKNPAKYEKLGARVPKGGLLVGPPGTGKTLLAKAVAGEADVPFYSMSGSDFVEMFVGVGPSRVRDLFKQARESAPSIIFIDEIDAVGRKRGRGGAGGNDERENTLNQMLVEMDGFSSSAGIVVLAGTNRSDVLDPALTRPGRFDRQIAVDKPDLRERESIFMVHLRPVTLSEKLSQESVAKRMAALTPGFAGSDIANICNEAAIFAARRSSSSVEMQDFERATERVLGGLPKHNSLMSTKDKRTIALHESGHAISGWFLEYADPLLKVSIVPRSSGALGFAQYLPEEMSLYSREAILDKIAVSLGGRAAEELFVGRISTGASDDLDKVTKMAYSMVSVYGMNPKLGLLSYSQNSSSEQFYKPYSEDTGQLIDREARTIVDEQYDRVKGLLEEKSALVQAMANALVEKETLVYNELRDLLGERPFALKEQYGKYVTASGNPFDQASAEADAKAAQEASAETGSTSTVVDAPPGADTGESKTMNAEPKTPAHT